MDDILPDNVVDKLVEELEKILEKILADKLGARLTEADGDMSVDGLVEMDCQLSDRIVKANLGKRVDWLGEVDGDKLVDRLAEVDCDKLTDRLE